MPRGLSHGPAFPLLVIVKEQRTAIHPVTAGPLRYYFDYSVRPTLRGLLRRAELHFEAVPDSFALAGKFTTDASGHCEPRDDGVRLSVAIHAAQVRSDMHCRTWRCRALDPRLPQLR